MPHNARQGWLAAVLPADVRRVRVAASPLARTLADAGASLVDDRPDLELGRAGSLRGDARAAIVVFDAGDFDASRRWEGRGRPVRAARRVAASIAIRLKARTARKVLVSKGYRHLHTVSWDQERPLRLTNQRPGRPPLRERFPLGLTLVATRDSPGATLLERAAAAAAQRADAAVTLDELRTASWGVLAVGDTTVLRTTVGPARKQLHRQAEALNLLRERTTKLGSIVPWPLAHGRTGIANWLLEPRLPGTVAPPVLGERLLAAALDVLAELHGAGETSAGAGSPAADAEVLRAAVNAADAEALGRLGEGLEARLAQLPRSFAHGDFSHGNLLQEGGSLKGVVDWNKAKQGSLPLLDLFNLILTSEVAVSGRTHGRVFQEFLLPWARGGGDETARRFCARIGLELRDGLLEDLAIAWWLDRHAEQVTTYSDRLERPAWLRENIERPLRAVVGS